MLAAYTGLRGVAKNKVQEQALQGRSDYTDPRMHRVTRCAFGRVPLATRTNEPLTDPGFSSPDWAVDPTAFAWLELGGSRPPTAQLALSDG